MKLFCIEESIQLFVTIKRSAWHSGEAGLSPGTVGRGGDVKSAIDAMTIITEKMQYQVRAIPTREQREAMVMELVQSLTKIGSHLVSDVNLAAWQDLPRDQQTRFLTNFISALERTGGLLPDVVEADQEVSVSSDNLRKLQITFLVAGLDLLISIFYIYLSPDHRTRTLFPKQLSFCRRVKL